MKYGHSPDLTFYYALHKATTKINKTHLGSDIIETTNGHVYADHECLLKIGEFAFNITVLDAIHPKPDNKYEVIGTNVFFLPEGTISHSINLQFEKDKKGEFVVPPNEKNTYQILSGSGDFVNQRGLILQKTKKNKEMLREMMVYFEKM